MSRPLEVMKSPLVTGCQSKPTLLRMPCAQTSRPLPSGLIRVTDAKTGFSPRLSQTLHGAPTGT